MFRCLTALALTACSSESTLTSIATPTGSTTTPPATGSTPSADGGLSDLAFFQAVEVPVLSAGEQVPASDRNAPLVVGRQAVVRARMEPGEGWSAEVRLELDLASGGVVRTFAAVGVPDTLVVEIPADAMTEDATWSARVLDQGAVVATAPADGPTALGAKVTGPLRLHLVPFEVDGFVPDTSPSVVEGYRAALMAVYPVTDVELDVGPVEVWTGPFDLGDINVRVGQLQEEAMFAGEEDWNVTWYGMATGVATRDEYEGITGTSEDGGDGELVRSYFAAGAAFGDQKSEDTLIHEIGHTHRLMHAPCNDPSDPDPDFPYADGTIGVEGYDFRTKSFVPADHADMMGYCFPRWISDYDYAKLAEHVARAQDYQGYE
ncbi:MAG: hypothetical protein H6735_01155 [Alphaproteobacteria bacterium]|nr:hypothetical protein [Alphaproteobacteria bacterium]